MQKILLLFLFIGCKVYSQDIIPVSALRNDVNYLEATFKHLHPGLYRYNSESDINKMFLELRSKSTQPLKLADWFIALSEFCSKLRCGHTFVSPFNQTDSIAKLIAPKKVFPFYFKIINNKFIVTHNFSNADIQRGDAITAINDIPADKIIERLLTVTRADGNHAIEKRISEIEVNNIHNGFESVFDLYYPLFFSMGDTLKLDTEDLTGKKSKVVVKSISPGLRKETYKTRYSNENHPDSWSFKIINKNTAYFSMNTFAYFNDDFNWKNYIDSVFLEIKSHSISNLILDIRNNEGGSSDIRDYILSYITPKKITGAVDARRCVKYLFIPDSIKKNLSTWDKSFFQPKDSNEYFINEIGLYEKKNRKSIDSIDVRQDRFKGYVYLLTNAENSSATFDMAWTFQENQLGKIIGEKTGGTKQGLNGGQMFFFKLPGSRIEIDLPLIYYYRKAADEQVTPDYIVTTTREDIASGKDSQLEFTLQLIK